MNEVTVLFMKGRLTTENSACAKELFDKSHYGVLLSDGRVELSMLETIYLLEKQRIRVVDGKNRRLSVKRVEVKASKESDFWLRYAVFRDFRNRGYVIKTALKFGADFRVYNKGVRPGQDHAKWIIFPVKESQKMTWQDFAAKNRVAHSTKKRLLIAVVDDEGDVSYWESRWLRP